MYKYNILSFTYVIFKYYTCTIKTFNTYSVYIITIKFFLCNLLFKHTHIIHGFLTDKML
jgi:hypothetical protein